MIIPYQPVNLEYSFYQADNTLNSELTRTLTGIGQIGSTVYLCILNNGSGGSNIYENYTPIISPVVVDSYGYFEFTGWNNEDTSLYVVMNQDDLFGVTKIDIPGRRSYTYSIVSDEVRIMPSNDNNTEYTFDGGITWNLYTDGVSGIVVPNGLYTPGTIMTRYNHIDIGIGPEYTGPGVISPYDFVELHIDRVGRTPNSSDWLITGTGDIDSRIDLISLTPINISSTTVDKYGYFELQAEIPDVDIFDLYNLNMNGDPSNLNSAINITFPVTIIIIIRRY